MLDYKLVEALACVVRDGGFDKAARRLRLSQSAVSQRIKLLEEQTGQILLARTTPPQATPAGRQMLKHYRQVTQLESDLFDVLNPAPTRQFAHIAVGVNADSLAIWFLDAVIPLLKEMKILIDVIVEDQERTHRFLRNGDVVGCIGTANHPIQGCHKFYLGRMEYLLVSAPEFADEWFARGLNDESVSTAPALMFNHKDDLHNKMLFQLIDQPPAAIPMHYLPSSEKYVDFIAAGLAYGLIPESQCRSLIDGGRLIDLAPEYRMEVELYWHCWNLNSPLLEKLTQTLLLGATKKLRK
ncbi:MAG: LysR family transcriptional regulator ArgP [Desulfobacteraceae bacterium]|nr:LysR family transcriptional regulator ArgP [Desulfobacteraceae bacterium]